MLIRWVDEVMDSSNPFTNNSFAALFEDDEEAEAIRRSSKVKSYNSTSVEKRLESSFRAMEEEVSHGWSQDVSVHHDGHSH